jgi:hypothetical protein
MGSGFFDVVRGFTLLFWLNLKHYSLALFGIRLRLDPDYPAEARFRGDLIVDSVLEYRGYGLFAPWSVFLALAVRPAVLWVVIATWSILAWRRTWFYSTPFRFWTRAYQESPNKHRNRIRYGEEIALEIQRKDMAGVPFDSPEMQELIKAGMALQNCIVERKK